MPPPSTSTNASAELICSAGMAVAAAQAIMNM